jgi:2-oxoglutarate ferredoxin oxidoreductase subunit alpha
MVQCEDEIASLNFVLGAFYAGTRSMTSTSGPGLSLMVEAIGLAGMAEIPAVIVDVQRGGPSTGMPTKTEQSDLSLAVAGSHGDPSRVVLAPVDIADCAFIMTQAFDIAETYQVPVIVLSDQYLGFGKQTVDVERLEALPQGAGRSGPVARPDSYLRYEVTPSGISPRSAPGDPGGVHTVTGLEHTPTGKPTFDPEGRLTMMNKRIVKLEGLAREYGTKGILLEGDADADVAVVGWGSTYGAAKEAVDALRAEGRKVRLIYFRLVAPLPEKTGEILGRHKKLLVVENNATGQFIQHLRASLDIHPARLLKYDGTPFTPSNIREGLMEVLKS